MAGIGRLVLKIVGDGICGRWSLKIGVRWEVDPTKGGRGRPC